ncbi:hypothetical protein [Glutamicibacter sp. NPDC087344]|uniref:hypothetical protein n=1 Tax=Glutamicibacter sp. NPDC087344 TaxID=3363994 RepID=UPI0037F2ECD8
MKSKLTGKKGVISMSSVSNLQNKVEVLSPAAQAVKDRCVAEAGAVFARICAELAAEHVEAAA